MIGAGSRFEHGLSDPHTLQYRCIALRATGESLDFDAASRSRSTLHRARLLRKEQRK